MSDDGFELKPISTAAVPKAIKKADQYQRYYYGGLVLERQARAYMCRGKSRVAAYDCFRDAMDHYEKAERIRPEDDDSALLRWNACLRTIRRGQLHPPPADEREQPL